MQWCLELKFKVWVFLDLVLTDPTYCTVFAICMAHNANETVLIKKFHIYGLKFVLYKPLQPRAIEFQMYHFAGREDLMTGA